MHDEMSKNVFVFDHIPKCGGSSMYALLHKHIGSFVAVRSAHQLIECADKIAESPEENHYLGGHYVYGVHDLLPKSCNVVYYTLLRNPLEASYSLYRYLKKVTVLRGSFIDFLYDNPCNSMTTFLGGSYENALVRLKKYRFVGFLDQKELSLRCISSLLKVELSRLERHNATENVHDILNEIDTSALREVMDDLRLYEYFRHAFDRSAAKGGLPEAMPGTPMGCAATTAPPQPEPSQTVYVHPNAAIEQWSRGRENTKDIAGLIATEESPDRIFFLAMILGRNNRPIGDETFDRILEALNERFIECLNASQISSKYRFEAAYEMAGNLAAHASLDKDTVVLNEAKKMFMFLASSAYARQNGLSVPVLQEICERDPHDPVLQTNLVIQHRLDRDFGRAMEMLDRIHPSARWTTYSNEYFVTKVAERSGAFRFSDIAQDDAFIPHRKALRFLDDNFRLSDRKPLEEIDRDGMLVLRSGPLPVLDDLLASVRRMGGTASIVMQKSLCAEEKYRDFTRYGIDDGWFDASRHEELKNTLQGMSFGSIVLLCSDFNSLNKLHNFLVFCRAIPSNGVYAYPISNLFAQQDRKSFVPLQ